MKFNSLEEKCRYYQSLSDHYLLPNSYVLCHLDGRSFSKNIKNNFNLPFSDDFILLMNQTAAYLAQHVQGCKLAYVQSDEISLVLSDFEDDKVAEGFFGYRMCKIQSICASMASTKFNQLRLLQYIKNNAYDYTGFDTDTSIYKISDIVKYLNETDLAEFDCKCWNVPDLDDAIAWLLYRQLDCIKNSKQQAAQTYCTYPELLNLTADQQIDFLYAKTGIDWNIAYDSGKKLGRFISKTTENFSKTINGSDVHYERSVWKPIEEGLNLADPESRKTLKKLWD